MNSVSAALAQHRTTPFFPRPGRLRTALNVSEMPTDSGPIRDRAADLAASIRAVADRQDKGAFGELFEHFGPRIKSYFMKTGLPAARSEELAQETMLNVWRKAAYFDPDRAGAATWIFTIARNLRIDQVRRERSEQAALDEPFEPDTAELQPDDLVTISEREARVRVALSQLSSEQIAVVRLSFFAETPHAEIASQLGIPLGTVKSRIRLAMARLRDLLGDM